MNIHHIGYLIKNMEKSLRVFQELGYKNVRGGVFYDPERDADICFVHQGGYRVELIAPRRTSELYGLLKRYKNTAYHICYQTSSLEKAIEEMESRGFKMFKEPQAAPAIGSSAKVAFFMHSDMGMVELVEDNTGGDK